MKKRLAIFLTVLMLLCCVGCSESAPETLTAASENPQSTSSSVLEPTIKQMGETIEFNELNGAVMEYTVEKVQVFDHYSDAGIKKEDCDENVLKDSPFVLIDVKCKKCSGPEWEKDDDYDDVNAFSLTNREAVKKRFEEDETSLMTELCYFSDPVEMGTKLYTCYWLEPGEEKVFQLGWCLHDGSELGPKEFGKLEDCLLTEPKDLLLEIGGNDYTAVYVDLKT